MRQSIVNSRVLNMFKQGGLKGIPTPVGFYCFIWSIKPKIYKKTVKCYDFKGCVFEIQTFFLEFCSETTLFSYI